MTTYIEWRNRNAFRIPAAELRALDNLWQARAEVSTLNPATCEMDGVTYVAEENDGNCEGCVARNDKWLCQRVGGCVPAVRPDGKDIIWIKGQA